MELENKPGLSGAAFDEAEERIGKRRAKQLFEEGVLDTFEVGACAKAQWRDCYNAPALLRKAEAPAAPGWHPQDAPGLVAPARRRSGATATTHRRHAPVEL